MRHKGFTLIELLIVVAIIAILAAIAVPNFLEAQTRAKVSRTRADMRSVATGLEAYRIDNNDYPPDFSAMVNTFMDRLRHLTTPVAYLTTLPEDIFGKEVANGSAGLATSQPYREGSTTTGAIIHPIVFDYASFDEQDALLSDGNMNGFPDVWDRISSSQAVVWALSSPGPNTQTVRFLGSTLYTIYDATNGTISEGQILRTSNSGEEVPASIQ